MYRQIKHNEIVNAIQCISNDGYAILREYLQPKTIEKLATLVEKSYCDETGKKMTGVPARDANDKIVYNVHSIDKLFIDILTTKPVEIIAKDFLNDQFYRFLDQDKPNYVLTYYNARSSGDALDLHIDSGVPFIGEHPIMMQFVFLLEDSNASNGCTVIMPKSHQSGTYTDRSANLDELLKLEGKKGDLIIWDSRTWHGTIANKSGNSRWALVATLSRWWLKQSMNIPKTISNELYRELSDAQKLLLGFCSIPPSDPFERVNTKTGYDFLKPNVDDYEL